MKAQLRYANTPPTKEQLTGICERLQKELGTDSVEITCLQDESITGGFIVSCGNFEYDWSDRGRAEQLREELSGFKAGDVTQDPGKIISMLKEKIDNFDLHIEGKEVGVVTWVGDGIANVEGIEHTFYGEIIEFEDGTKGMAQDIRDDHIGCILFGEDTGIRQGSRAVRTYKEAGIPVGDNFVGRVIDALGAPIDGLGNIKESGFFEVERRAPGIIERQPVCEPMETGILSIDTMFPIGRGQRELIIGDRQTGKTSIAIDAIINQKGKGVICIYVAIGQKASTVASIIQTLQKTGAMKYTIVVSSTASDTAPLQYIAPYSGTAMGEYFMRQGRDVLIVYDDLSKHAVAYRALSLLLERSPGREAYPGDVFYLHSRLLERSSKLSSELGGGSMTALPIIETLAGDVSAYIPTNVISITDGQIFLESDLFFAGMRPAVNVGLSVSRVGSAAQTRAMKKAAGSIRVDLAQYREMAVFTQFSSDLDEVTKKQLNHGNILMELLKQPLAKPLAMHEQVIILVAVGGGRIDWVDTRMIQEYKEKLLAFFNFRHTDICDEIKKTGDLTDVMRSNILQLTDRFNEELKEGI
ncbi:MAG: F0F1 ATP synthase subunit alpha [Butyrivibrio sp.]|nr:F0F1 ATP synthase subunit alpha [Butyrivibrio sp.]